MGDMEHKHYESECESDLEKDDADILARRYERAYKQRGHLGKKKNSRIKSHWTRVYDVIQEHFSSHVNINKSSYMLPPNIYAMKHGAKQSWLLYKKRECERRKRLRVKMDEEKRKENDGVEPSNMLLSLVDTCECCKKLYIAVNLFWGITLCDICYFNSDVIEEIMKSKEKEMKKPVMSESIGLLNRNRVSMSKDFYKVKDDLNDLAAAAHKAMERRKPGELSLSAKQQSMIRKYYTVPTSPPPPPPVTRVITVLDSPDSPFSPSFVIPPTPCTAMTDDEEEEKIVEEEEEEEEEEDIRSISTYQSSFISGALDGEEKLEDVFSQKELESINSLFALYNDNDESKAEMEAYFK